VLKLLQTTAPGESFDEFFVNDYLAQTGQEIKIFQAVETQPELSV